MDRVLLRNGEPRDHDSSGRNLGYSYTRFMGNPVFTMKRDTRPPSNPSVLLGNGEIARFREKIMDFYRIHGRHDLAWRQTTDPYHVLVSEIMLQQTRVESVTIRYPRFILRFPTIMALAGASLAEVLETWKGLGYNRRAIALRDTARIIVSEYSGLIPEDEKSLSGLPGVGKHTAGSIRAFAFNLPSVFIETNIRRVFIHCFFVDEPSVPDSRIRPLVEATLDLANPREWYFALMDYGAALPREVPNPNRRSTGYRRQPAFAGSDREIRGLVLDILLKEQSLTSDEIGYLLGVEPTRCRSILADLDREGFIHLDGGIIRLRD